MTPLDWQQRWADDAAERLAILEADSVPDAEAKARKDVQACREREEKRQQELWGRE